MNSRCCGSVKGVLFLGAFVLSACGSRGVDEVANRSSEADSLAASSETDVVAVFDPDGYYSPVDTVVVGDWRFSWVLLHTLDQYYDGELHYDDPRPVVPPEAILSISGMQGPEDHECVMPSVTVDTLSIQCSGTPLGDVSIKGRFLDSEGSYSGKLEYEITATVLLIARVVIMQEGRVVHDAVHEFFYSAGH